MFKTNFKQMYCVVNYFIQNFLHVNKLKLIEEKTMVEENKMTQEEQQQWVREQYLKATKYLADQGKVVESVADTESRYLVPVMSVWKLNLLDKTSVWVISGDLPTDHIVLAEEESARNVVRHFSYKWQLQADNILQTPDHSKEQQEFAQLLIGRAEGLYQLFQKDDLWRE